jgi:hypothetical protein
MSTKSTNPELEKFMEDHPEWSSCPDLVLYPPDRSELAEDYPELDGELLGKCLEVIRPGVTRGAVYSKMRLAGESHRLSEMVALQRCVGLDTDDVFFSGQKPLYDQFESQKHLDRYLAASKKRGFTPSVNSTYFPNLARFQGDPEAYVTRAQGRSYIRSLCEKRGWACEGGVTSSGRGPEVDPFETAPPLADSIVRDLGAKMVRKDPSLSRLDRRELREKVLHEHGPTK